MKKEYLATPANIITIVGMFLAALTFITLWTEAYLAAIILWLLGWLTDWLDGAAARWFDRKYPGRGLGATELGGVLDPIRDKALVLAVIIPAIHLASHLGFALIMTTVILVEGPANYYFQQRLKKPQAMILQFSRVITCLQVVPFLAILLLLYLSENRLSGTTEEHILIIAASVLLIMSILRVNRYEEKIGD